MFFARRKPFLIVLVLLLSMILVLPVSLSVNAQEPPPGKCDEVWSEGYSDFYDNSPDTGLYEIEFADGSNVDLYMPGHPQSGGGGLVVVGLDGEAFGYENSITVTFYAYDHPQHPGQMIISEQFGETTEPQDITLENLLKYLPGTASLYLDPSFFSSDDDFFCRAVAFARYMQILEVLGMDRQQLSKVSALGTHKTAECHIPNTHIKHIAVGGMTTAYAVPQGTNPATGEDGTDWVWFQGMSLMNLEPASADVTVTYSPDGFCGVGGGGESSSALPKQLFARQQGGSASPVMGQPITFSVQAPVLAIAISPDETLLATGDNEGRVQLWNTQTGELVHDLVGHGSNVWSLAFSANGTRLASAGNSTAPPTPPGGPNEVRVWDVAAGQELHHFTAVPEMVWDVAFSPDGTQLVVSGNQSHILVFDVLSGAEVARIDHNPNLAEDEVDAVAFSPDGTRLAAGGREYAQLYDTATWEPVMTIGEIGSVRMLAYSVDGTLLFTGGNGVRAFDVATGTELLHLHPLTGETDPFLMDMALHPAGKLLYVIRVQFDDEWNPVASIITVWDSLPFALQ